jgi:hypothetical protein
VDFGCAEGSSCGEKLLLVGRRSSPPPPLQRFMLATAVGQKEAIQYRKAKLTPLCLDDSLEL